ncbi:MAG: potassium/proton antiporter [Actinomycetota bacterium]|nr:potassium/proton antiporter [Actinomycetota bacterium]MDQ3648340.1 potassium/proton antiporter [Actinomycetota bacterium]
MTEGGLILTAGILLAAGIGAALAAGRLRVPGLVLFLGLGMLLGSDGLALIDFGASERDVELARTIGVIALVLILFEGGLVAGWDDIRGVIGTSLSLATVGTLLTAVLTGAAAHLLLGLDWLEGLLLGSIVAATDSAAIFSVLRQSSLRRRLARTLEAESGLNDPVAVILVIGFIDWIQDPDYGVLDLLALGLTQLPIGAVVGVAVGMGAVAAFHRASFATQGLYPVASIATAGIAFGLADVLHGSGFLAVYIAGVALGSARIPGKRTVEDFHAGVAWVAQIALFLTLGLLVFPTELDDVAFDGLILAAVLLLVARPAAALVATRVGRFPVRDSMLVSWAGLRGALPVVFATFPVIEGIPEADRFFNLVFFVVLLSALLQGATFEPLARALGLTSSEPALSRPLLEVGTIQRLGAEVLEFPVGADHAIAGRLINELGLPRDALVNVLVRGEEALLPRGSTQVEAGDRLHILVREPARAEVEGLFDRWRHGPIGEPAPAVTSVRSHSAVFSVRPWREEEGDAGAPEQVNGVTVARSLRTRRGARGSLVQLEDARFAVIGDGVVAIGGPRQVFRYCRERIGRAEDPEGRAWWQEVAGVLSQRALG